jgi:hypothetical protein
MTHLQGEVLADAALFATAGMIGLAGVTLEMRGKQACKARHPAGSDLPPEQPAKNGCSSRTRDAPLGKNRKISKRLVTRGLHEAPYLRRRPRNLPRLGP